jgi:hypothetical protein
MSYSADSAVFPDISSMIHFSANWVPLMVVSNDVGLIFKC